MSKYQIPIHERYCLSVDEAAEYSMLGENRLRKIIDEDKTLDWVLYIGSWIRVKRPQFEKWLADQNYL